MLILFDHGTPAPLRHFLTGHTVKKAKDLGWDTLINGELLKAAEAASFQVLVTTDKNIRHQQNLSGQTIAIVVLGIPQWPILRPHVDRVVAAVNAAKPGTYCEVEIPEG
jgi:hypothetical protein